MTVLLVSSFAQDATENSCGKGRLITVVLQTSTMDGVFSSALEFRT